MADAAPVFEIMPIYTILHLALIEAYKLRIILNQSSLFHVWSRRLRALNFITVNIPHSLLIHLEQLLNANARSDKKNWEFFICLLHIAKKK